jgi:hypothetical protein
VRDGIKELFLKATVSTSLQAPGPAVKKKILSVLTLVVTVQSVLYISLEHLLLFLSLYTDLIGFCGSPQ